MLEEQLTKHFLLPIDLNKNTYTTPENLYDDLELIETKRDNSNNSLYEKLLSPNMPFSYLTMAKLSKKYTNDIDFLKNIKNFCKNKNNQDEIKQVLNAWNSYKILKKMKIS